MTHFLLNIILAVTWAAVMGTFDLQTILAGFAIGYGVLWLVRPALRPSAYLTGLWRALGFAAFYVWELVLSSIRVAIDVCRPRFDMRPGVVAVPLTCTRDAEITLLANLISLTPGTLSLDVSADRRLLFVHAMDMEDGPDAVRHAITNDLERRVLAVLHDPKAMESPVS